MRSIPEALKALERPVAKPAGGAMHLPAESACPRCKDAGCVRFHVPIADLNFGRLVPCECRLSEHERRKHEELLHVGNLGPFEDKTFENVDPGASRVCWPRSHPHGDPDRFSMVWSEGSTGRVWDRRCPA